MGDCMKKDCLKIGISFLVFIVSFQIMYSCSVNLTEQLFKRDYKYENSYHQVYQSPVIQVLTYLNSEEYAYKRYIETAIGYLSAEPKDVSSTQIDKYNSIFPNGESSTPGGWCTEFVLWGLLQADKELNTTYVGDIYPLLDSGYQARRWYARKDRLHTEDDYLPKTGDMMFFKYYDSIIDHTALVVGTKEENGILYVLTIEGNVPSSSDKGILERMIPLDEEYIYGYGSYE